MFNTCPKVIIGSLSLSQIRKDALHHVKISSSNLKSNTNLMSLPPSTNTYEIAGLDDLERGFNRQVEMNHLEGHYQANFRYEKLLLSADPQVTEAEALLNLIAQLHKKGYTQLRSRLHFRGDTYLGTQELWKEHPDPEPENPFTQLVGWIRDWWDPPRL